MHYILIDYENVQPADLADLDAEQAFVLVFTGADQKVGIGLVEAVQARGEHGRFIRITGNGRNALDFHIACYLGQWMVRDPTATFLIVSGDAGFDPLIAHLNAAGTRTKRINIEPPKKKATKTTSTKAVNVIVEKAVKSQPAKKKVAAKKKVVAKKSAKATQATTVTPKSDADRIIKGLKGMAENLPGSEASLRRMASALLASKDSARMDSAISELGKRKVIDLTQAKVRYLLPK